VSEAGPPSPGARPEPRVEPLPGYPDWTQRLLDFDPRQVMFAHDNSIWHPAAS
jgi:hypothetical protein